MSTVIRGIFSKAAVFVNTGTNCSSFLKATGSPSTKMISELFAVSVSIRDLRDRCSKPGILFKSSIRGLELRSFRIVLFGKSILFLARQSLKVYKLRKTHFPVESRMSDVAAKIFEESLNKVVLVQLKGGRTVTDLLSHPF